MTQLNLGGGTQKRRFLLSRGGRGVLSMRTSFLILCERRNPVVSKIHVCFRFRPEDAVGGGVHPRLGAAQLLQQLLSLHHGVPHHPARTFPHARIQEKVRAKPHMQSPQIPKFLQTCAPLPWCFSSSEGLLEHRAGAATRGARRRSTAEASAASPRRRRAPRCL